MLYINADDFGRDRHTTDRILDCCRSERVSSVSAMMFMSDSERAAELAMDSKLDVGLHLNLTDPFPESPRDRELLGCHRAVNSYLSHRKVTQFIFNPFLKRAFDYTLKAQWDEFSRLYGHEPGRLDGHQHMHLCANTLVSFRKLPRGLKVRRHFTFRRGEKCFLNRWYRALVDRWLKLHFECTDFFFSILPMTEKRLTRILELSESASVELMVHPARDEEYWFLLSDQWAAIQGQHLKQPVFSPTGSEQEART